MIKVFELKRTVINSGIFLMCLGILFSTHARDGKDFKKMIPETVQTVQRVFIQKENPTLENKGSAGALQDSGDGWQPVNIQTLNSNFQHNVWLKFRLPQGNWSNPELFLQMPVRNFEVFEGRRMIYRSRDGLHERRWSRSNLRIHFIRFDPDSLEQTVYIRILADRFHYKVWGPIKVGDRADFIRDIFRSEFADLIFTFFFIGIGLCLMIAQVWNRKGYLPFLGIGLLAFSIGTMKIPELLLSQLLWDEPTIKYYGEALSFYLIPAGFILYNATFIDSTLVFRQIKPLYKRLMLAFISHGLLMVALDFTGVAPVDATYNFYVVALAVVVTALMFTGFQKARQNNLDTGLTLFGTTCLGFTGIHDIIGEITGSFSFGQYLSGWGMLIYVICMILFMVKRFIGFNRELEELNKTLEARVLQRTDELENVHRELGKRNLELNAVLRNLQETQLQLIQAEKMVLLGNLVAGIAFEIKTPLEFTQANVAMEKMMLREIAETGAEGAGAAGAKRFIKKAAAINVANKGALDRIIDLVKGLKNFARLDEAQINVADLHEGIDSTLLIICHQLHEVEIVKEYGPIPPFNCYPQQLNQVFLNLFLNAIQALQGQARGTQQIIVRTQYENQKVIIRIKDTGPGIATEVLPRIFQPRFTTKENHSGLGLPICREIITRHRGQLIANSEPGSGAEFIIELPTQEGV